MIQEAKNYHHNEMLFSFVKRSVEDSFFQLFSEKPSINNYIVCKKKIEVLGDLITQVEFQNERKQVCGFFNMIFTEGSLFPLLKKVYGKTIHLNKDRCLQDGVCEITNIIFGGFKKSVTTHFQTKWQMKAPQLIKRPLKIQVKKEKDILIIPFKTSYGPFAITLNC